MMESFFHGLEGAPYQVFSLHSTVDDPVEQVDSVRYFAEIRRWAIRLRPRPEPVVVIFGRMTVAMTAAWFGAILAGKLPAFISHPSRKIQPEDYARKLANYVQRFSGSLFVGEERDRLVCPDLLSPADPAHDFAPGPVAIPPLDPEAPLFLQCSSGTTGLQKAVAITAGMLNAQVLAHAAALELKPRQDHMVSWLPLYHDMGLAGVFLPALMTRTPLTLLETFAWAANPGWLLRVLERERGSLCWLPNFAFSLLARVGGVFDLSCVRSFINCSEPVSSGAFSRFMHAFGVDGACLSVCYALAENVFAATRTPSGSPPKAVLVDPVALGRRQLVVQGVLRVGETPEPGRGTAVFSCGMPLSGVAVDIVTRSGEEQVGEIWLRGPCVVSGYYGQPALRQDGWLPTGDLGFWHGGELYLTGRSKDLIIHNGKNIHPVDVEEVVSRHPEIHPGRVVAMGRMEASVDSEQVLVLFELAQRLPLEGMRRLCQRIRQELDALFDMRSVVDCVPRNWLRKTSSGKMARKENLQRYQTASQTRVHVVGDSHVRIFWSGPTSHHNRFQRIHAHWLGALRSDNWQKTLPFFAGLLPALQPSDVLMVQCGEPECRSVFAVAGDPLATIQTAVSSYRVFFSTLRQIWPGRFAYLTGIPTHPGNIDNGDLQWPIRGTPEARYHWQKVFYQAMEQLCTGLQIHFIDVCTPLLGEDGFMDAGLLCDKAHLDPGQVGLFLERFGEHFGHLDLSPNHPAPETRLWDGTFAHFQALMRQKIREIHPLIEERDWERLVSGAVLDSLGIVELIAMLDRTFHFNLDPGSLRREDFESVARIWERFGPGPLVI
ncbi:MAG: AMP-binding protein [Magnetococcales bacterium]|nr:AMP-binding protein [Magnetococcales bacterium]